MRKELRVVDKERGIVQITLPDERFYHREILDPITGLPSSEFVPAVSWIASFYPKGIAYMRWLASKGFDEAEAIKSSAGDRGSRVHLAINDLIQGKTISIDAKYQSSEEETPLELSTEEYACLMAFKSWHEEMKPEYLASEFCVFGDGYAGTVDALCKINGEFFLCDWKTSQDIYPSHEIQVSAYKHALEFVETEKDKVKLAILQVGYRRNKKGWKFTEIQDQFPLFLAAKTIWAKETKGIQPLQKDYPLKLKLELKEKDNARLKQAVQIP